MIKKVLTLALACLVVAVQAGAHAPDGAQSTMDISADVRAKVDRAGTGEKARVTVWLKDGSKRKGYVSERHDAEFVLRDPKTDAPTVIAYGDAARIEINRGHSTFRKYAIGTGVAFGVLVVLSIIVVRTGID
jgi:hypothetical protein